MKLKEVDDMNFAALSSVATNLSEAFREETSVIKLESN